MKTLIMRFLITLMTTAAVAQAQEKDPWIGKRVFTRYGTVLKVGDRVVDDEGRTPDFRASGRERQSVRVYRVERTNGEWLWLQDEKSGVSGWVQSRQAIPYDKPSTTGPTRSSPTIPPIHTL